MTALHRDYVIIGGGVYGAGLAWELARRGRDVLLLEADRVASGASGGLGKRGVRANGRDIRELPLMHRSYELWPELAERIGADTGYERTGGLRLIEREREKVAASAQVWTQTRFGIPSRLVGRDELAEMEPGLSDAVQCAIFCPLDGVADHTATTRSLAQAALAVGAEVREDCRVTSIERRLGRAVAVHTTQDERIAVGRDVIVLANTGVAPLLADLGVTLPVWQRLPQVLLTEPVASVGIRHLIGHAHRRLSMKAGPEGRVMISGGWLGQVDAGKGEPVSVPEEVEGNLAEARRVFPGLAGVGVAAVAVDRWESQTVDDIPIIDRIPGLENGLFATGWSGHGWAIAPAVVELLAAWVIGDERPALLQPFAFDRFQQAR